MCHTVKKSRRPALTLDVKEEVGAKERENQHGDWQGAVGHDFSDFAVHIGAERNDIIQLCC